MMDKEKQYGTERKAEPVKMKRCGCQKNKKNETPAPTRKAEIYYGDPAMCDPLGSYTGKPSDEYEVPVQDADDL